MIQRVMFLLLFLTLLLPQLSSAEKIWQAQNSGIDDADIRTVAISLRNDELICAASKKCVYFSQNKGDAWEKVFSLAPAEDEVNFVTFSRFDPNILYLATTKGLFLSKNQGRQWERVFRGINEEAQNVTWVSLDYVAEQKIYLGTSKGLYVSSDAGGNWQKVAGGLPHSEVRPIALHPTNAQVLYLANTYGIFKSIDAGQTWKRIYVTSYRLNNEESEQDDADEAEEESPQISENQSLINCIAIDKGNTKRVFMAGGQGVFVSADAGETWNKLPEQGLSCKEVNFIVVADKNGSVYAATQDGVFEFLPTANKWQEIYQGKTFRDVHSLALNIDGTQVFAGTNRGIFRTIDLKIVQKQKEEEKIEINEENKIELKEEIDLNEILREISLNEPTIQEVQQAALRYAEVIHPERIRALRRNAKIKALLPDVSLDYDKTIYSATGKDYSNIVIGPQDWGLSLSWNVGDIVFNEQVRLIDSNARLLVQLRDDILSEVTRLYYERRKLQTELILRPPKTAEETLTKRLRLEELTANIDALTGGYFSHNIKRK